MIERAEFSRPQQGALRQIAAASDGLQGIGITTHVNRRRGSPAKVMELADQPKVDLFVMLAHGQGGATQALFGSVGEAVYRKAALPLLIVPANADRPGPARAKLGVLVPLDGSLFEEKEVVVARGTHGRGELSRLVLGSVASGALDGARVPILLCPPSIAEEFRSQADRPRAEVPAS